MFYTWRTLRQNQFKNKEDRNTAIKRGPVLLLVICIFMGITVISIGLGAAFPSINKIAAPLVCPNGEITVERNRYNVYPGKTVITNNWYCVDQASISKSSLSFLKIGLIAGTLYGVILFAALNLIRIIKGKRAASNQPWNGLSVAQ